MIQVYIVLIAFCLVPLLYFVATDTLSPRLITVSFVLLGTVLISVSSILIREEVRNILALILAETNGGTTGGNGTKSHHLSSAGV
jgi:hypothetical protein